MLVINRWADLALITDPAIMRLLAKRRDQLQDYDEPADFGGIHMVEPGDSITDVEEAVQFPIATNSVDGARYPDPAYVPAWEWIEHHGTFWEAPYVLSDDGAGFILIVPDADGIDLELLALCRRDATTPETPTDA